MSNPLISFVNHSFKYFMRDSPSLSNINLSIKEGEFVVITGASGSGKSSLAYSILGLIPSFYSGDRSGKVLFKGEEISDKNFAVHCKEIGYISQRINNSFATPYVFSELAFPLEYSNEPTQEIGRQIVEYSTELNIDEFLSREIQTLSEGEKQLISFGSATIDGINLIVADEPLANLDRRNRKTVLRRLENFHKSGKTLIVTTHEYQAYLSHATRVIVLQDGRIKEDSSITNGDLESNQSNSSTNTSKTKLHYGNNDSSNGMIEVSNLTFNYSNRFYLEDISFSVRKGQVMGIVGDNGSGKTTLLKLLCGLIDPHEGKIRINDEPVKNLSWIEITEKFGIVFQDPDKQFFESSVENEITLISKNLGIHEPSHEVSKLLMKCEMEGYETYSPQSLSFGEKRRLAFLSAIQHKPDILLIDEVTVGMDNRNKLWFVEEIQRLKEQGKTIVLATHDWDLLKKVADMIIHLESGKLSSLMDPNQYEKFYTNYISMEENRK